MNGNLKISFEDGRSFDVVYGTKVRDLFDLVGNDEVIALRINGAAVHADYELIED